MNKLSLHSFHARLGASFMQVGGQEAVAQYGDPLAELQALRASAGVLDLSFRGRLCLTGADRQRFLHGQVTNDVNKLKPGEGCYAALVTAKGKMVSDLHIYRLEDELLLDFEPGLSQTVAQRLEHYIISEDVQVTDAAPHYGLLSIQGPKAAELVAKLQWPVTLPSTAMAFARLQDPELGEIYLVNRARIGPSGIDLFVPTAALPAVAEKLDGALEETGGRWCGWTAFEIARMEAAIPRFGAEMDETNLPPEAGLEARAISYSKGCYIGQEVLARIRTYGQVAKTLRILRLADSLAALPARGDLLLRDGKEVGVVMSALASPTLRANIAFAYVRREANALGGKLTVRSGAGESEASILGIPFQENFA